MKKIAGLIICALCILMCACQATPAVEPVPNKGDRKMEEMLDVTPVPTEGGFIVPHLEVPSHWTEDLGIFYGTHVAIDADIEYSDAAYPVYLIRNDPEIDGTVAEKLRRVFIDADRWRGMDSTRDELLERLEMLLKGDWTGEYDPETGEEIYVPFENADELIAEVMKQLEELDPSVNWSEISSVEDIPKGQGYLSDGTRSVYINRSDHLFVLSADRSMMIEQESDAIAASIFNESGKRERITALPEPSMARELAVELTNGILEDSGLVERLGISYVGKAQRVENDVVCGYGWEVVCMFKAPGAKMLDPFHYDMNGGPFIAAEEDAAYRPSSRNESLHLYFEDGELMLLDWTNPQTIVSEVTPAVALLPFDEIMLRIKQRLEYGLAWHEKSEQYYDGILYNEGHIVSSIFLTYFKAAKADDVNADYWVPVWAVAIKSTADETIPMPPAVLLINAIDGTFITPGA